MDADYHYIIQIQGYTIFIIVFIVVLFLAALIYLFIQQNLLRKKNEKLLLSRKLTEKKLNDAHFEFIGTKLNPHLFKNILNSVQSHAYQTYISLERLANILDYILYESNNKYVSPKEEFDFTKSLIDINKIKINPLYDFRFKTNIDETDPMYNEKVLIPLATVDLIENAFKHTDFLADDSFISIHLELENGLFYLKVSNKAAPSNPKPNKKSGFGSQSLEQRLKIIYGNHYTLNRLLLNGTYTALLKINLSEFYSKMRHSG